MHAAAMLSPELESTGRARRFVVAALARAGVGPDHAWVATLLAHELVANAVVHARGDVVVHVLVRDDRLRVEVSDDSPVAPHQRHPDEQATSGRGLQLVAGLAHEWGIEAADNGKSVWFSMARSREKHALRRGDAEATMSASTASAPVEALRRVACSPVPPSAPAMSTPRCPDASVGHAEMSAHRQSRSPADDATTS